MKKTYIQPQMMVVQMETCRMICTSMGFSDESATGSTVVDGRQNDFFDDDDE